MFVSSGMDGRVLVWDTSRLVPVTEFKVGERAYVASMPSLAAVGSSHCLIAVTEVSMEIVFSHPYSPSIPHPHRPPFFPPSNPPPNPPLCLAAGCLLRCGAIRCGAMRSVVVRCDPL